MLCNPNHETINYERMRYGRVHLATGQFSAIENEKTKTRDATILRLALTADRVNKLVISRNTTVSGEIIHSVIKQ